MNASLAHEKIDVLQVEFPERAAAPVEEGGKRVPMDVLGGIPVDVQVRLGSARLTIQQLMELQAGSLLVLEQPLDQCVEVVLNDRVVAHGDIVAVGDHFGIRIRQLAD